MAKSKKIIWINVARRGTQQPLLTFDAILESYRLDDFRRAHGITWTVRNWRQFDHARWFGKPDMEKYQNFLRQLADKQPAKLAAFGREYGRRIMQHRAFADKMQNKNFSQLDNLELARIFSAWFVLARHFFCFAYDYIFLNTFLPDKVTAAVAQREPNVIKQNEYLAVLLAPDEISEVSLEKENLIRLASTSNRQLNDKLKQHLGRFAHLGFYYFYGSAYILPSLKKRLQEYRQSPRASLQDTLRQFKKQKQNSLQTKQLIKNFKLDRVTVKYIRLIKQWGSLSTRVDETYGYVVYKLMPFWREICRRLDISYEQFYSLQGAEIINALHQGKLSAVLKQEAKLRHKIHGLILVNGQKSVLAGVALRKYTKKEKIKEVNYGHVTELRGQAASPGKVQGRVQTIFVLHDVAKVDRGDILVASSTNPTYVPAMERAAAIVTDEGGLLSHAAIVSRELRIPCVVGTKIATRVLKDGDKIEVDASQGVVRKI